MFQIAKNAEGPPRPAFASPLARDFLDCCLRYDPHARPSAGDLLRHPFVTGAGAPVTSSVDGASNARGGGGKP